VLAHPPRPVEKYRSSYLRCRVGGRRPRRPAWPTSAGFLRDTYFEVARGGLKLREEQPVRPHLIQFERASEPQQRESRYRIIEVSDGASLCAALATAIGIRGVVVKHRLLLLWQTVRIHLDEVERLGTFMEFDPRRASDPRARGRVLLRLAARRALDAKLAGLPL
jgi:adenylate cyclase, class 2